MNIIFESHVLGILIGVLIYPLFKILRYCYKGFKKEFISWLNHITRHKHNIFLPRRDQPDCVSSVYAEDIIERLAKNAGYNWEDFE